MTYLEKCEATHRLDLKAKALLESGRLMVDQATGLVYARESKTPEKPVGTPNKRGYLRVCITTHGVAVSLMGRQINHKDGVKANNLPTNLELAIAAENNEHARKAGLWRPATGTANGSAKLSDEQVAAIRLLRSQGVGTKAIAEQFKVTASYVRRVVSKKLRD